MSTGGSTSARPFAIECTTTARVIAATSAKPNSNHRLVLRVALRRGGSAMTAHKSATQPEAVQDERLLSRHNLQAAALLAVLIAANYVVFRKVFNTNYFRWYVDNGTILALVLATAAVGLNLDAEDGLI